MTATRASRLRNRFTGSQPLQQPEQQEATPTRARRVSKRLIDKTSSNRSTREQPSKSPNTRRPRTKRPAVSKSSAASASVRPPSHRIWLDALPPELCKHIATWLSRCEDAPSDLHNQTETLLHLAEVSDKQRHAVVEALSYRLVSPQEDEKRWAAVFHGMKAHFVSQHWYDDDWVVLRDVDWSHDDLVLPRLRADMLTELSISNRLENYTVLRRARQLRTLGVKFTRHSLDVLRIPLKKLDKLTMLRLHCFKRNLCLFKNLFRTHEAWADLADLCPGLSELEILCTCAVEDERADIGPLVGAFPKLRRLTFNNPVPDQAIPYLQGLESVAVQCGRVGRRAEVRSLIEVASRIGGPVTRIQDPNLTSLFPFENVIDTREVALVAKCPRVCRLDMVLKRGAESALPRLRHLQSLRLSWETSIVVSAADGLELMAGYAPPSDFFSRIVQEMPDLKELCLFNVCLSLGVIDVMLEAIGPRLEVFGTSLRDQSETAVERAVAVMESASRFNASLQQLVLHVGSFPPKLDFGFDADPERLRLMRRNILRALDMLHRRAPRLNYRELRDRFKVWMQWGEQAV